MDIRATLTTYKTLSAASSIILLTATLLSMTGCHKSSVIAPGANATAPMLVREGDKIIVPAASPIRARLLTGVVGASAASHAVSIPGVVEADQARTVNILPPLSGRLVELKVKLGDTVKQGQSLAVLSSPDLAQAFADADKARDARELARRALQRARAVNDAGANASKDLEQAESNYTQTLAESSRADARLKVLGATSTGSGPHGLSVAAPMSGTVTALNSGVGSYLNDLTAPLMTIANFDKVWVTANVPENLVAMVSKGQAADISLPAYPAQVRHGTIDIVSSILEPDTRRTKARISLNNVDGKLKPNMFASVSLSMARAAQATIPSSALLMNNDSTTVFVEVAPWTFVRRTVELGDEDGETVSILAGLRAGDRVLVRGGVLLND